MTTMMTQEKQDHLMNLSKQIKQIQHLLFGVMVDNEKDVVESRPMLLATSDDVLHMMTPEYNMDLSLVKTAQVAVVPKYSAFQPLVESGHRFLIAEDGMYLEVRRPWLYFVHRLAEQAVVAMPFGKIAPCTELAFGRLSAVIDQIQLFVDKANSESPNEWAAMLVWDAQEQRLVDGQFDILDSTPGSVRYACRDLADHESLAIDLHSHGNIPAFFSSTDDRDDAGSVKISGVVGNLDSDTPTAAFRLCVLGLYLPINVPADRIFGSAA